MNRTRSPRSLARFAWLAVLAPFALTATGCAIGTIIGGMTQSYRESSTRTITAEYTNLTGKNFAVLVTADRTTQADFPNLSPVLTARVSERLAEFAQVSGWIPPQDLLSFLYDNPSWVSMPPSELADELGVDRLIMMDIYEFRLNDPGNRYLWDGRAAGVLTVIEADTNLRDTPAFVREIDVSFPDASGFGPGDFSAEQIASILMSRFVDRSSWLFYDHEEPYYPDY